MATVADVAAPRRDLLERVGIRGLAAREAAFAYSIVGVRWFPLADDSDWGNDVHQDRITSRNLRLLQEALGYSAS